MAVIQPYEDRVIAQGAIQSQASPNDFGAQVGQALENVGSAMTNVAMAAMQNEVSNDVTQAHVLAAKQRAYWQQELQNRANSADPGDETFAPKLMDDITKSMTDLSGQFKTRQGQQAFTRISADMASMFGQEAIGIQGRLAGENAKIQYTAQSNALGSIAAQDHTQWKSLYEQGKSFIDDPNGPFAKVPQTTRDAFKQSLEEQIKYDAAKGFARRYPNAVLGSVPAELRSSAQAAVANQPRPGLPPNLGADTVKPYDQKKIDYIANKVAAPSPYDDTFKQAAQLYNLDWRELKMRSVAESNLNPSAQSSQGAGGIMQMTPETARDLGVDANDPKAAIFGAAKLIAQYRTQAGGDMTKVDKMYYGGAAGTAWGPNTNQYAANLAAVRQSVGLGTAVPPEAFSASPSALTAASQDWKKPSTGIDFIDSLPADKFFQIVTEAEHYQRAYDSQLERDRIEQQRVKKEQQDGVMSSFLSRIVNPTLENGGKLSEPEIISNPTLTWEQKQHMVDYAMRRTREMQSQSESKTNPAKVRELMLEIHAADDDPRKTYNTQPVMDAYKAGEISTNEMVFLRKEVEQLRDGNTGGFQKDVQNARNVVYTSLTRSILGQVQPEVAADAAYRFSMDMERQIAEYRKQNKDPRVLLDPSSREYLLKPERIQSFMPNSKVAQGDAAAKVVAQQASQLPTYKDYDKIPKGSSYTDPQGNVRVKGN